MGLDPDEVRDTSMVAEYSTEIFNYMARCERETMANPNYMDFQREIHWHMRATLVDWLLQVHMRYHMLPETLWIAINVVDRFLSVRVVEPGPSCSSSASRPCSSPPSTRRSWRRASRSLSL